MLALQRAAGNQAVARILRAPGDESRASVHQRVLKGMIQLVKEHPADGEDRLEALTKLFATVPDPQVAGLYNRLQPGAPTDDFAQYFKNNFPTSRKEGLAALRTRLPPGASKEASSSAAPVPSETIGKNIGVAGCSLPTKDSGSPSIHFGQSMSGDGWKLNPKYWVVEYILIRGGQVKTFTASKSRPSAWQQVTEFLDNNQEWNNSDTTLNVRAQVGQYGASAAINDVWNPGSSDLYSIDCLAAAMLIQLRGVYLSYPEATRDADFDRDQGSFKMERFGDVSQPPTSSLVKDFEVTILDKPLKLTDQAAIEKTLQQGDSAPITNPYFPSSSAWATENTIYVGGGKFFGHPFGVFDLQTYGEKLGGQLDPSKSKEERTKYVLEHSFIASFSRPRDRAARKGAAVSGPQTK